MSYGIQSYMTSIDDIHSIWNSKIKIGARDVITQMREKLGFDFLPKQTSTDWLKRFNKEMKKDYPNYMSYIVMQDLFDGNLTYTKTPWIYSYLLESIAFKLSQKYFNEVVLQFKQKFPNVPTRTDDNRYPSTELIDYQYSRLLLKSSFKSCHLPNSEWYPCDVSIINYLPNSLPMPIPEADDFPFVSSIYNKDLKKVLERIDFNKYTVEAKNQMTLWFDKAESEGRDLILFLY